MSRSPRALARVAAALAAAATFWPSAAWATDDALFAKQWSLSQIGAPAAWATSKGAGVTIGIVDTGVDQSHPDLAGKVVASANCVGGTCVDGPARDVDGHGTIVAGIAAADTGNGIGIAGVAPDAHLVVAKVLDDHGAGTIEDITNGIEWVVAHGARIVNLSLGDPDETLTSLAGTPLRAGIEYAWSRGAIPVLAAGNYERIGDSGSFNYGTLDAIVVGATDQGGRVARYSVSLGNAKWGVVAPGGSGDGPGADVLSTLPNGHYGWAAGTSMAAPQVSGVLALLLAQGLTPSAAVARLLATVDHSVSCGSGCQGFVRADAAVAAPPDTTPSTAPPGNLPTATVPPRSPGANVAKPALVALAAALVLACAAGVAATARRLPAFARGG